LTKIHYFTFVIIVAIFGLSAQASIREIVGHNTTEQLVLAQKRLTHWMRYTLEWSSKLLSHSIDDINRESNRLNSDNVMGDYTPEQTPESVINAAPPISLFYNSGQKPKAWTNQQGRAQGFAFDVAAAILTQAKIKFIAKGVPFNRGLKQTKQCNGLMTGVFKTKERQKSLSYSLPIVPDKAVVITRADSTFEYKKMSDLNGKRIAYLRGAAFGDEFEQAVGQFKAATLQQPATMLKLLLKGRVDVVILNPGRATVEYAALDAGIYMNQLKIAPTQLAQVDNYLVFCNQQHKKNQPMLRRINSAITTLKQSGRFDQIMAAY